jgi:membrane protein DedA with SNARE-associated domain
LEFATLQTILRKYGLLAVFGGTFYEGETVLITAGILSAAGLLKPLGVWLSASFGGWSGHLFWFFIGRIFGMRSFLTRKEKIKGRLEVINKIILTRPKTAIFILQYLYGMRIIGALGFGMTSFPFSRFMCYEALNCLVWAAVVLAPAYFLGQTLMYFFRGWFRWVWLGLSILVIVLFSLYLRLFYAGKRIKNGKMKNG